MKMPGVAPQKGASKESQPALVQPCPIRVGSYEKKKKTRDAAKLLTRYVHNGTRKGWNYDTMVLDNLEKRRRSSYAKKNQSLRCKKLEGVLCDEKLIRRYT